MKRPKRPGSIPEAFRPDDASAEAARGAGGATGAAAALGGVRIIGGQLRGRVLPFGGDPHIRPMKDRVREAVFNLLADDVKGRQVIDLFAGTGVLGFEAISRGAARALLLERHFPTAKAIQRHAEALGIGDRVVVEAGDTFVWVRRLVDGLLTGPDGLKLERLAELQRLPWVVFCCPPYSLYESRRADLLLLVQRLLAAAPANSRFVVESDERFDPAELPDSENWQSRVYPPATISMLTTFGSPS
jgi:16S rRNA (guanine(966)-N(2))-methyltransferase RsmD